MENYLFAHFIGEEKDGEQIYFSISRDGLHWDDLNQNKPVLMSGIGEKGVRDPFVIKNPKTGIYYLIATDLCVNANDDWKRHREQGSTDIIIWQSKDFVDWPDEKSYNVQIENGGCAWAPEAIWDEEKEAFFVFWATWVKNGGDDEGKHRIYYAYTPDFCSFTKSQVYIEHDRGVIDTTIIRAGDFYYRFTKDESSGCIIFEKGTHLLGEFTTITGAVLDEMKGLEGPECYQLPDGRWCLICDQFAAQKGYLPIVINDLEKGDMNVLSQNEYHLGTTKKRHGGVIKISECEYEQLAKHYK